MATVIKDLTGKRFGMLVVQNFSHSNDGSVWMCKCDCGSRKLVSTGHLNGGTKSCGCAVLKAARDNQALAAQKRRLPFPHVQRLKNMFRNMHDRCYNPGNKRWMNYGGKEVEVCEAWHDRHTFYKWVSENGFEPGLQIDRINVNGNYEPSNCRFVDAYVQMNNTTRNVVLRWNNRSMTIAQWSRELKIRPQALQHRVDRRWTVEEIFTVPYRRSPSKN